MVVRIPVFGFLLFELDSPTSCAGKFIHPSASSHCPVILQPSASLRAPRLAGHFQVLKDISDACAR